MKQFFLGALAAAIVLPLCVYCYLWMGLFPAGADSAPGAFEKRMASLALNAHVARNAPKGPPPVQANEETLLAGVKVYKNHCEGCHGAAVPQPNPFAEAMNPPIPQFGGRTRPFGETEGELFYFIKHGIRFSGMPAYGKPPSPMLSDEDIWKVALFLKTLPTPPAAVDAAWKSTEPTTPK
ncbi:MAG: cytochrome c [Armatimonadetes bacterium]|nr:cytochrome c [Armatimonadota bacterium]